MAVVAVAVPTPLVWVLINGMWWLLLFIGCLFSMGAYHPDFTVLQELLVTGGVYDCADCCWACVVLYLLSVNSLKVLIRLSKRI